MDLLTVTNKKYIKNAINLINSYKVNLYNKNVFLYYFDIKEEEIDYLQKNYRHIHFLKIPKVCEYAYNPTVFLYKVYAISDCIDKTNGFIYSDATNVFNSYVEIDKFLIEDSLFLPYNNNRLLNKFWTTQKCFEKMECNTAKVMPQYWAGFQVYKNTADNRKFTKEMYEYMLDPEVALPDTSVKNPDGILSDCIEHRQDQSVLSILIHKNFRDQKYDHEKQLLFGDWQTFKDFDNNYVHSLNCCLSSRESKFGYFRYFKD